MLKKTTPELFCPVPVLPSVCRGGTFIRGFLFLFLFLLIAVVDAQTATDSSKGHEGLLPVPETQDTITVSHHGKSTIADSADIYLSTDTNTHDIEALLNSGYVMPSRELRHIPPERIKTYQSEDAFAYANDPAYWQKEKPRDLPNINFVLWWRIFLIICGAFLVYGIYHLSKENFSGLFKRKSRRQTTDEREEQEEELLTVDELEKKLAAAIAGGDFRSGVRLMYLKLIKTLEARGLIPAGRLSTNSAWATVFSDPAQARQFRALSGAYEYVFYGGFEPDEQQFVSLRQRFSDFTENIPV